MIWRNSHDVVEFSCSTGILVTWRNHQHVAEISVISDGNRDEGKGSFICSFALFVTLCYLARGELYDVTGVQSVAPTAY